MVRQGWIPFQWGGRRRNGADRGLNPVVRRRVGVVMFLFLVKTSDVCRGGPHWLLPSCRPVSLPHMYVVGWSFLRPRHVPGAGASLGPWTLDIGH